MKEKEKLDERDWEKAIDDNTWTKQMYDLPIEVRGSMKNVIRQLIQQAEERKRQEHMKIMAEHWEEFKQAEALAYKKGRDDCYRDNVQKHGAYRLGQIDAKLELLESMYTQMYEWAGTGKAMVEDFAKRNGLNKPRLKN